MEIKLYCHLPASVVNSLRKRIDSLADLYHHNGKTCLTALAIASDDSLEYRINRIIKETTGELGNYKSGPYSPGGVAVPLEVVPRLSCIIVLTQSTVKKINNDRLEALSTLYEELLHVKLYTLGWNEAKRSRPPVESLFEYNLFETSRYLLDEYCVIRTKVSILAKRSPKFFWYGDNLIGHLDQANIAFKNLDLNLPETELLNAFFYTITRYVFEPLARDAAYKAMHSLEVQRAEGQPPPENSSFYCEHVQSFWKLIHDEIKWTPMSKQ